MNTESFGGTSSEKPITPIPGGGAGQIMEEGEAKRYEQTLEDIDKRKDYPRLTKLEQSFMRDDAIRMRPGEKVRIDQHQTTPVTETTSQVPTQTETPQATETPSQVPTQTETPQATETPSQIPTQTETPQATETPSQVPTQTETPKKEQDSYRKALNSVPNADRTLIAQDKKRRESGESFTTTMEEDEAKRYEQTLEDRDKRKDYPNLSKLDQSLMRDDAERIQRGESVSTTMEEDEAKRYEQTLEDIDKRKDYPNLSKLDQSLMRDDAERIQGGESVSTIMEEDEAKRYEQTLEDIDKRKDYPNLSKLDQSLMRDDAERIQGGESVSTIMEEGEAKRYEQTLEGMEKRKDDGEWIEGPESKKPERPDTPEELLTKLDIQIKELEEKEKNGPLTYEEYLKYRDLRLQRNEIQKGLQEKEQAEKEKRERKNKWIKIVAGIAGAGIAIATPAVSVAALIGITVGGRIVGKSLNKWGESLRKKSRDLRYQIKDGMTQEQIEDIEKKQRRNAWWGERLTEASSVLIGGSTGYGLGKAIQGIISSIHTAQQANNISKADSPGGENVESVNNTNTPPENPIDSSGENVESVNNTNTPPENPIDSSGENIVEADVYTPLNTPTESIPQTEGWLGGKNSWDVSKYGWDPAKYGWGGTKIQLEGSVNADLQKTLLQTIENKVPEEVFFKAGAQDAFHRALSSIYSQGSQSVGTVADRLAQELLSLLGN